MTLQDNSSHIPNFTLNDLPKFFSIPLVGLWLLVSAYTVFELSSHKLLLNGRTALLPALQLPLEEVTTFQALALFFILNVGVIHLFLLLLEWRIKNNGGRVGNVYSALRGVHILGLSIFLAVELWQIFRLHNGLYSFLALFLSALALLGFIFQKRQQLLPVLVAVIVGGSILIYTINLGWWPFFNLNFTKHCLCPLESPYQYLIQDRNLRGAFAEQPVNFERLDFRNCDFSGANLALATFDSCYFSHNTRFKATNFQSYHDQPGTIFKNCTFRNVDFSDTDLSKVKFTNCQFFPEVDFSRASLRYTRWEKTVLSGAVHLKLDSLCINGGSELYQEVIYPDYLLQNLRERILQKDYHCRILLTNCTMPECLELTERLPK